MTRFFMAIFAVTLTFVAGCADQNDPVATSGQISSTAQTESGSVRFTVWADSDELRTVDQLGVRIKINWASSEDVKLFAPDWEGAGWTLVDSYHEPDMVEGAGFSRLWSFTIEPFLEGQYSIPPIEVDTNLGSITSEPIAVSVHSVLDTGSTSELAEHRPLALPSEPESSNISGLVILGAVGGLILAFVLFWLVRKPGVKLEPTPRETLQAIADGDFEDAGEAFRCVHRVVSTLRTTAKTIEIETECEQARFNGCTTMTSDPRTIAMRAIRAMEGA